MNASAHPGKSRRFTVATLTDLPPQARCEGWLWRGYLAGGQLTLLTSLWKSGKTTLLATLLSRMDAGGELLGQPVLPARALVLSEENVALWQHRHARLAFGDHVRLMCQPFAGKPTDDDWRSLTEHAAAALGADGRRLLVIDTVATLLPAGAETNADCMVRALAPLRRLADQGVAVWLMHHPHKGKARAGEWSRGSGSLPASVDIALEMHPLRPDDLADRRRVLLGWSRHEETPRRRIIEWTADGTGYRVLDEATDPEFDRGWTAVRRVLAPADGPQTAAAILRAWPADSSLPSRATLHRWLARAVERHLLRADRDARRNAPYRYSLR